MSDRLEPFKFPGGKAKLAPAILAVMGKVRGTYCEPYLGSGAMFYAAADAGLISDAVLSDADPWIARAHTGLGRKSSLDELAAWGDVTFTVEEFERLRAQVNAGDGPGWAGAFCALQGAAFNGMYRRAAKSGLYNVPWCKKAHPPIPKVERIQRAAKLLEVAGGRVANVSALVAILDAADGDAVYLDPPYVGCWSAYGGGVQFTPHDLQMLVAASERAAKRGVKVLLHHLDTPLFRGMVAGWDRIIPLSTPSRLSPKASTRGARAEVLAVIGGAP